MSAWQIEIANWWLERGYAIIPCQPLTKEIMFGFGAHLEKRRLITSHEVAEFWTQRPRANLAIVCPPNHYVMDFDDRAVYDDWATENPDAARSYSEVTALRGGLHVFGLIGVPKGLRFIRGIEVKNFCVVAPSQIQDESRSIRSYARGRGEIIEFDAIHALRHLTKPCEPTAYLATLREADERRAAAKSSRLAEIKEHYAIIDTLKRYRGELAIGGHGRWRSTYCPFHKAGAEKHASFWIDTERGTWGCQACGLHGDVINLYALLQGITNAEAIRRMSEVMA